MGSFAIRIVVTKDSQKEQIKKAAEAVQVTGLETEKIDESSVLELAERDGHMYVCDPFEGDAFNHLIKLGCRIVGPQCVISCLENELAVPKADHPVYSISMYGVTISCSSVEKSEREKIHKLVQWMGGTVSKNFTDKVTHLVAGEVGSKKYHVAASFKKPIMLPEWVVACWEKGKDRYVSATDDSILAKYSCPIFKGCIICVTGLESELRRDVSMLTDENGGRYSGELKFNECTHLVVNSPKGPKYEFARKWKIHCVSSKWFFESVEKNFCQDENLYRVDADVQATSTPNGVAASSRLSAAGTSMANFSAISNISMASAVDDTAMTEANLSLAEPRSDNMKELDELDLSLTDAGLFLDGCKVFLSGFSGARLEKLRKIINTGGATRFNQINESVSHVVMGRRVPEHISLLMQSSYRPHVVTAMWLVDSFKQTTQATEENYICLNLPPLTSASPANHSRPEKQRMSLGKNKSKERSKKSASKAEEDAEDADMMQQYLPGAADQNETTNDSEVVFNLPKERDPELTRISLDDDATQMDDEASSEEEVTILEEQTDGIFAGKSFVILGFPPEQEEQILDMLITNGGKVKAAARRGIADFAVVPINGCKVNVSVHEVISNCWLQMCMEENMFLDPTSNPLFTPISIMEEASPLCDCVVTISQFSGVERDCLVHIAELLGANCQEYFSRKATEALRPNTHLLLKEPNGSKYKAAKKWKVPAVTKDWLLETARTSKRQPEKKFLVDFAPPPQDPSPPKSRLPTSRTDLIAPVSDEGATSRAGKVSVSSEPQSKSQDLDHQNVDRLKACEDRVEKPSRTGEANLVSERQEDSRTSIDVNKTTGVSSAKGEAFKGDNKENSTGMASKDAPRGTPVVNKHLSVSESGGEAWSKDTPSKFLGVGTVFHPTFDTKDALAYLESPAGVHHKKRHTRKSSLPLDDFFHMNIAKALQKTGEQATNEEADETVFHEQVKSKGVLDGVILSVSRKLVSKQAEYNTLAVSLGAEFRWTFDDSCTHFIFKGRANDTSKEFRAAKSKGMRIVSPVWLQACEEEERRVDETSYPHTYNPKMSLSVVSTRRETPSRTPARSSRKTRSMAQSATPCPPPAQAKQPTQATPSPQAIPTPQVVPTPHAAPAPHHDETAMDGFGAGSTDSDEELMRIAEAAEMGEVVEEDEPEVMDNEEGSLEQRENLQKQLEGFMTSTMNVKGGRRRSRMHKGSSSGIDTSSNSTSASRDRSGHQESGRRTRSSRAMVHSVDGGQAAGTSRTLTVRPPEVHPEASQNVQITWDDQSGRKEREKIMAHLKRSCSPSQDHAEDDENMEMGREVSPRGLLRGSAMGEMPYKEDSRDSAVTPPTPRAPSIRLPVANPPVAPQPRKQNTTASNLEVPTKPQPTFLLSGMSQDEKIDYSDLIEKLGAVVKDGMYFVPSCTHIVVGNPTRNEKYLACLASGKWVLHKSFLEASRKAGEFVEEELHEWGSATDLSTLNEQTGKLALAACRWRRQLQEHPQAGYDPELYGAFSGWRVILYIDRQKEAGFKRILQAGGAKIASMRPPFGCLDHVTYAFMDLQKTKTPEGAIDLEAMASAGILCLKPEFIADFLMQDEAPPHSNYFISEVKPIMERLYENHHSRSGRTPSKRKQLDSASTPRSKKGRVR
ncbi:DNA topoisomerase 2-binding protein 1-like isoform X1 [Asterias amurensis]|uniref:DNA topoisomerase 2-binding protein 1-like isoform X1 n=1 Tax=Asterias amurensis TaxID=7602 RepID=UPI003AB53DCD